MRARFLAVTLSLLAACNRVTGGSSSSAAPPSPSTPLPDGFPTEVTLPFTRSTAEIPAGALVVVVSRSRVAIGADGPTLAVPDPATWENGLDPKYKQGKPHNLFVAPLAEALAERHVGEAGTAPPVVVAADASVPYAVLTELVFTLGLSSASDVSIAGRTAAGTIAAVVLFLPRRGSLPVADAAAGAEAALELWVAVERAGYGVSARHQRLAPGCQVLDAGTDAGLEPTIAKGRDGAYDESQLAACLSRLKGSSAVAREESSAVLSADAASDLQTVVRAIDALHGEKGDLFADVALGLFRR